MRGCYVWIVFASKQTRRRKKQLLHQKHSVVICIQQGDHRGDCVVRQRAARLYWQYTQQARTQVLSNAIKSGVAIIVTAAKTCIENTNQHTHSHSRHSRSVSLSSRFASLVDRGMRRAILRRRQRCHWRGRRLVVSRTLCLLKAHAAAVTPRASGVTHIAQLLWRFWAVLLSQVIAAFKKFLIS